nr:peptidyl-prolyl cis-trans isomerase [Motiliproteus sediminis]
MRQTFYHGRIPEAEANPFRHKIANQLVDEYLLAREAIKRGIEADREEVAAKWQSLDKRNAGDPEWAEAKERLKPVFEADWVRQSLAARLIESVRAVPEPSEAEVRAYYQEHLDLFKEPASHRVSIILLGVDPGAGEAAWVDAEQRAAELVKELENGADFAELAMLHSTDFTADQGGDMGVLHEGMVGDDVQKLVETMAPGDISQPKRLLQGVAIFQLAERIESVQHPFEAVQERAGRLQRRDQAALAEELLRFELRQAADVHLNEAVVTLPGRQ